MNRRAFLTTLGGAISAVAAQPMLLIPTRSIYPITEADWSFLAKIDLANALAFAMVSNNSTHPLYYRNKALAAFRRFQESREHPSA